MTGSFVRKAVARFFRDEARFVARHPLIFLLIPLFASGGFCYVLIQMRSKFDAKPNVVRLFVPDNVPAARNAEKMAKYFTSAANPREESFLISGSKGHVTLSHRGRDMLSAEALPIVQRIATEVRLLKAEVFGVNISYSELCYRENGFCSLDHPVLIGSVDHRNITQLRRYLRYPYTFVNGTKVNNAIYFGGVTVDRSGVIIRSMFVRLPYALKYSRVQDQNFVNYQWERQLEQYVTRMGHDPFQVSAVVSYSLADEIQRTGKTVARYIPMLIAALALYMLIACMTSDCVTSKPLLGLAAIVNAVLAVVSSMGTLFLCDVQFIQLVMVMPFLLLSLSIDSLFLLLNSWRLTHPLSSVESRLGETLEDTSVSITVAMLTDIFSFAVGCISQTGAVRIFCAYCALAMAYAYVYQNTFLLACMAYSARREDADRHCITFRKVDVDTCCGRPRHSRLKSRFRGSWISRFFGRYYAKFIRNPCTQLLTMFIYVAYLVSAAWGVMNLRVGLTLNHLIPNDSPLVDELVITDQFYQDYNQHVQIVLEGQLPYYNEDVARYLVDFYRQLANTENASRHRFWLESLMRSNHAQFGNKHRFQTGLSQFLREDNTYLSDISILKHKNGSKAIIASKMAILLKNANATAIPKITNSMQKQFRKAKIPGFVFHEALFILEQEERTIYDTIQNLGVAVGAVALISTVFIFNCIGSFLAGLAIISINYGVIGYLAFWDVHLDLISMLTMVMSIGLSADYVVHVILHHFSPSATGTEDDVIFENPVNNALRHVGGPMLQSAISTIAGIACLAIVQAYMVEAFVKTVILVVSFGVLHGLLILPVVLSLLVNESGPVAYVNSHYRRLRTHLRTKLSTLSTDQSGYPFESVSRREERRLSLNTTSVSKASVHSSSAFASNEGKLPPYWALLGKRISERPRETISGPAQKVVDLYGFVKHKASSGSLYRPHKRTVSADWAYAIPSCLDSRSGASDETLSAREYPQYSPPQTFYTRPTPINSWRSYGQVGRSGPGIALPPTPSRGPNVYMKHASSGYASPMGMPRLPPHAPISVDIPDESSRGQMVEILIRGSRLGSRQNLAESVSNIFAKDDMMSVVSDQFAVIEDTERSFGTFKREDERDFDVL